MTVCLLMTAVVAAWAQESPQVEMADVLRRDGKIYTVVISLLLVLIGLIVFLVRIDRRVGRLDQNKGH